MENEGRNQNETMISFFDQDLRWWQDVYREDLPRGFFSFEMRRRLELVAEQLTTEIKAMENPAVLECGCGPGDILKLIEPLPCQLTGLDLNPRYLDLAAEKVPGAKLLDGNIEELPLPDASFDVVYAVGVLQYLNDDQLAVREISRVTKDGGFVLISVPNYRMLHLLLDPYYLFRTFRRILGTKEQLTTAEFDESKIRRFTLKQLRKLFADYGMNEIRSMSTSFGPLKFWRREVLPLAISMRSSEVLRKGSEMKIFSGLKHVGNHLLITLRKGQPRPAERG